MSPYAIDIQSDGVYGSNPDWVRRLVGLVGKDVVYLKRFAKLANRHGVSNRHRGKCAKSGKQNVCSASLSRIQTQCISTLAANLVNSWGGADGGRAVVLFQAIIMQDILPFCAYGKLKF